MADKKIVVHALQTGSDLSFSGLFVVGFSIFLVIAVFAQMLALPWRSWMPGAEGEKSMVGGVRAAVQSFMSHIP